jgi:flagellar biogenesis protein FliO
MVMAVACGAFATGASAQTTESRPLGRPAAATSRAATTSSTTPASLGSAALRTGASLVAVLALAGGASLAFKHLAKKGVLPTTLGTGARAPSGLLEVLARYPMGGGQSLVVLKFDRRILLVCQSSAKALRKSASAITPICELTEAEDVASVLLKVRGQEQAAMAEKFQRILAGEDAAAERAISAHPRPALPAPKAHERAARASKPVSSPAASASAIRSRLAALREQSAPDTPRAPSSLTPLTAPPARRTQRTEFVA